MAQRTYRMSFKGIAKQLHRAAGKLGKIRPKVGTPDRKKIDLQVKALKHCTKMLSVQCDVMTHIYKGPKKP